MTTNKPVTTIEEVRRVHNQQPPSTATKREWEHIDFLLAEVERTQKAHDACFNRLTETIAEVDKLKAENTAFGEFVCRRCHLRQDAEPIDVSF